MEQTSVQRRMFTTLTFKYYEFFLTISAMVKELQEHMKSYPDLNFSMTSSFCIAELLPLRFTTPTELRPACPSLCWSQSSNIERVREFWDTIYSFTCIKHQGHGPTEDLSRLQVSTMPDNDFRTEPPESSGLLQRGVSGTQDTCPWHFTKILTRIHNVRRAPNIWT